MPPSSRQPILAPGEVVGERWTVVRKVGEGGFAEVYEVALPDSEAKKALKIDRSTEVNTVSMEHKTMQRLQRVPQLCRLVEGGVGRHRERSFFVMELLGQNLVQWRSQQPQGRFPPKMAAGIAGDILNMVEGMHRAGYVHRDVKPANFALTQRPNSNPKLAAIDFGLARRYVDDNGAMLPKRAQHEFRGSTSYASIAAHLKEDVGRKDDLFSLLYILVELLTGTLPWRREGAPRPKGVNASEAEKQGILQEKQECLEDPSRLSPSGQMPACVESLSIYLAGVNFEDHPDYGQFRQCLQELAMLPDNTFATESGAPSSVLVSPTEATTLVTQQQQQPTPHALNSLLAQLDSPQSSPGGEAPLLERGSSGRLPPPTQQQNGHHAGSTQRPAPKSLSDPPQKRQWQGTPSPLGGHSARGGLPPSGASAERDLKRARLQQGDTPGGAGAGMGGKGERGGEQKAKRRGEAELLRSYAALVTEDRVSGAAVAVKEQIQNLRPAEGMAVLAWMVSELGKRAEKQPEIAGWLRSLASVATLPGSGS